MAKKKTTPVVTDTIPENTQLCKVRIKLNRSHIPIWREVVVPSNILLYDLHLIIQGAMGWTGGHLSQFTINGLDYSTTPKDMPELSGFDSIEEDDTFSSYVPLDEVLEGAEKFTYLYDFGDSWEHSITVKSLAKKDVVPYIPYCVAGKGECPPDDIGGVWGYAELCKTINGPDSSEKTEMLEWLEGWGFPVSQPYPPKLNLETVNERLKGFVFEDPADYESDRIENENKKKERESKKTGIPFIDNIKFDSDKERDYFINEILGGLSNLLVNAKAGTTETNKKTATKKTTAKKTTGKKTTAKKTATKKTTAKKTVAKKTSKKSAEE